MTQRIMVVDDDDSARLSVELALTMAGYSAVSTADGREAIDTMLEAHGKSEDFDLLITDLRMPGMSGEQLIDELNALEISVPKLVISAYSDDRSIRELSLKGCHDYYEKPLNPRTLIDRVGEILKKTDDKSGWKAGILPPNPFRVALLETAYNTVMATTTRGG